MRAFEQAPYYFPTKLLISVWAFLQACTSPQCTSLSNLQPMSQPNFMGKIIHFLLTITCISAACGGIVRPWAVAGNSTWPSSPCRGKRKVTYESALNAVVTYKQ